MTYNVVRAEGADTRAATPSEGPASLWRCCPGECRNVHGPVQGLHHLPFGGIIIPRHLLFLQSVNAVLS